MIDQLKAYLVQEDFEGIGGVLFAKSDIEARRRGAAEWNDGELGGMTVKRAHWADEYRETGVPVSAYVEHGWWWECSSCGVRIDEDLWDCAGYYAWSPADIVGREGEPVYCDARCAARAALRKAEADYIQRRWIKRFEKIIEHRFPDALLIDRDGYRAHCHAFAGRDRQGVWRIEQVRVPFEYPGMQYGPASLDYDRYASRLGTRPKPHFTCAGGDREAFQAFLAETKRRAAA